MKKEFININGKLFVQLTDPATAKVGDIVARPATRAEKKTRQATIEAAKNMPILAAQAAMKKQEDRDSRRRAHAEAKAKRVAEEKERRELRQIRDELKKLEEAELKANVVKNEEQLHDALTEAKLPETVISDLIMAFELDELAELIKENGINALTSVRGIGYKRAEAIVNVLSGRLMSYSDRAHERLAEPDDVLYDVKEFTVTWDDDQQKVKLVRTNINKKRFGPAGTKVQELSGMANSLFTVVSKIDPKLPVYAKVKIQEYLDKATHKGITFKTGERCLPVIMGTNALMQNTVHYGLASIVPEIRRFQYCGANLNTQYKQKMAKLAAYGGLVLPYTKNFLNGVLKPDMEVLIPAWDHEVKAKNMLYNPDGSIVPRDITTICEFDGQCIVDLSKETIKKLNLTREEVRALKRAIKRFNGGTLRASFQKGLVIVGVHFRDMLKRMGVTSIQGKPIDDIAIFGDAKIFKASIGEGKLFDKFEDYCANFEEMKHRFGLLLENHGLKKTFLPAQQLNAVIGGDVEYLRQGVAEEVNYLRMAQEPDVAMQRYGNKFIATIGKDDPSFSNVWWVEEMINSAYQKERETSKAGRSHCENYTGFVCKDVVAMAQWIAFCEGVRKELPTGCLGRRTVYAPGVCGKDRTEGGTAIISRNPVVALYGLVEVEVVIDLGEWNEFFDDNFAYIMVPIGDLSVLLRMDFDGDKVRLTFAEWFINLVRSAKKAAGEDIEVFADWETFGKAYEDLPTDEAFANMFASATASSALGLNVSAITKVATHWDQIMAAKKEKEEVIEDASMSEFEPEENEEYIKFNLDVSTFQRNGDYMMNKGTDVKQGADGSSAEGEAGAQWEQTWNAAGASNFTKAHAASRNLKPEKDREPLDPKKIDEEWTKSPCDCFNNAVTKLTKPSVHYGSTLDASIDWCQKFICNRMMKITGLCSMGKKDKKTGEYIDKGLLNELIMRHKAEWAAICDDDKARYSFEDWVAWKSQEAWDEMLAFVQERGFTEADLYDSIVTYLFCDLGRAWFGTHVTEEKKGLIMIYVRQIVEWIGKDMINMYQVNLQKTVSVASGCDEFECDDDSPFA